MRRPRRIWLAFALCLVVVFAAMGWASRTVIRLDGAQRASQDLAAREELVRVALWRMDAALTAVVAQEGARPYFQYRSFYSVKDAYTRRGGRVGEREIMIPSPLLRPGSTLVRLYFRIDADRTVTSPQVPTGPMRNLAVPEYVSEEAIRQAGERLLALEESLLTDRLLAGLPRVPPSSPAPPPALLANTNLPVSNRDQLQRHGNEFNVRSNIMQQTGRFSSYARALAVSGAVRDGEVRSLWVGGRLVLARRVIAGGRTHVVGCWLDWPKMREWLLDNVRDILPSARLEALASGADMTEFGRLATLPVRLLPGEVPVDPAAGAGAVAMSLAAAWGGLFLAAGAVGLLLHGALSISERRGAFVSAVTHELRTPLTTLRMYTEMLADGMVTDDAVRRQYLDTLHGEANRLCRLVENVLSYSRLESRRPPTPDKPVELGKWLGQVGPRLARRARQAGMNLVIDADDPAGRAAVSTDPTALEQILANLVDNACKYAAGAEDRRIHVQLGREAGRVVLRVRDHGPGIPDDEVEKVFRPFFRAGGRAVGSIGGLGLGLAISRRLARSLGGELTVEMPAGGGASFAITLPEHR